MHWRVKLIQTKCRIVVSITILHLPAIYEFMTKANFVNKIVRCIVPMQKEIDNFGQRNLEFVNFDKMHISCT